MSTRIDAVLIGSLTRLGQRNVPSGIDKHPVIGHAIVRKEGILGDEQGDRKNHGGLEKAIHHYPFDHYTLWRQELPALSARFQASGAFGENICTTGITEAEVRVGDTYRLGSALVQVSQGRQPCWRLNERFGYPAMAREVQQSGRTGWYYRVIEEGTVGTGDVLDLVDRPAEGWTLARIAHLLYLDTLNLEMLTKLAELPQLSESWRKLVLRRIERRTVEDWSQRLSSKEG